MKELFVVATPIGNLGDLSDRAREVLGAVDLILAEDTRTTGHLLTHFGIRKRMVAYHSANEWGSFDPSRVFDQAEQVALVSENGTPCIMDPGHRIVGWCHDHGVRVTPIPGPSAGLSCLSASGFPAQNFLFYGFLPNKKGRRQNMLGEILDREKKVVIFYESPHRMMHLLQILVERDPALNLVVGRELTKKFEEVVRKNAQEMLQYYDNKGVQGEFVLIVDNRERRSAGGGSGAEETVNFGDDSDDT
ncbi:MAG: 16S rRNA (cytidine(1402)-2'-O)-methyltransferase [Spirochaetes bacterium]|nr:16S rRNA (cytidine(1402)-2'-O)-methyltransferase [Spirochaetota bacterium]